MKTAVEETLARAREQLLAARNVRGHWEGELSASALSTATAIVALTLVDDEKHRALIHGGLDWLAKNQNADGGWGDTTKSLSNISTTTLCWAAFNVGRVTSRGESITAASGDAAYNENVHKSESWLTKLAGSVQPEDLARAIAARYGKDRTFSVPILTTCALAGKVPWDLVKPLPFELAALPRETFKWLRLPVVSYALPALIAVGQVRHRRLPTRNPITRVLRDATQERTLRVLENIQPASGGFLEAIPLTSFVTMSLAGCGLRDHPVARRGAEFLARAVRADGSWAIDSNLATWVTTGAVEALGGVAAHLRCADSNLRFAEAQLHQEKICDWLLAQQHRELHPYTNAASGGWAWTELSGGVPDADDTAGALIALRALCAPAETPNSKLQTPKKLQTSNPKTPRLQDSITPIELGIRWLLDLQNSDGGIPTFCRGWGALAFDRSAPDLTAHAIRAWLAWREEMPPAIQRRIDAAIRRAVAYLSRLQRADGAWSPLWFGNQHAENEENLTYGTARVLQAVAAIAECGVPDTVALGERGYNWILSVQNSDGGWGSAKGTPSSIEETALAVQALATSVVAAVPSRTEEPLRTAATTKAMERGVRWLIERTGGGRVFEPSPIGFYFAKLWYYEKLYPLIFTIGALESFLTANERE